MKKYLVVIGGAGFVGSNLIELLLKKTKYNILSYDNYSSGTIKNHIKNKRVNYIKAHTKDINRNLKSKKNNILTIFHFGEFARIFQSFNNLSECLESNINGSLEVFKFCLSHKIKLIYSATSASLGNYGNDKNLSPYAFTKTKNLELLNNFKNWFNLKYEVIFFYNVYGPRQISKGKMATVIGIFEDHYIKKKPLPVVMPGSQSRRFTHIEDTVNICYKAWKENKCKFYSISNKQSYTIKAIAKMFNTKIRYLPQRKGERYASSLVNQSLTNKIHKNFGKIKIRNYINNFIKSVQK